MWLAPCITFAQQKKFMWATGLSVPGAGTYLYNGMKTDRYGNTYALGTSSGFSQGPAVYCAMKLNGSGQVIRRKTFNFNGASSISDGQPKTMVHTYADSSSVYITSMKGILAFDTLLTRLPIGSDMVAFRLDKSGNLLWWCQFGSNTEDELVATFDTHDSDIVIHGKTLFRNNQMYFIRPVNGVLVKDSTIASTSDFFDFFFTLRKDGTAGPAARIYANTIPPATILGAFALPGNKIEVLVRDYADMSFKAAVKKWTMNADGTSLTADTRTWPLTYTASGAYLEFSKVYKTEAGAYVASVTSQQGITYAGNDTFPLNKAHLLTLSNNLSTHIRKNISIAATPMHALSGNILWTTESQSNVILGADTFRNRNNQFVQHFIITRDNLTLKDTFQLLNQAGQSAMLKSAWLMNDSAEVTCLYNGLYDSYLDSITVKAGNKSWYHYAVLAKRGLPARPASNPNTGAGKTLQVQTQVYPNPCKSGDEVIIQTAVQDRVQGVSLYASDGRCVVQAAAKNMSSFAVPSVPAGVYVVQIRYENGGVSAQRLLVQ